MIEANLQRATELFHEIDRLKERLDDAKRMAPSLVVKYLMEPNIGRDAQGNQRVIEECDAALLLELEPEDVRRMATDVLAQCLSAKIEVNRKALKKLGIRLEDDVKPPKSQKSAKLLQLPAPVRKKGEAA